MLEVMAEDIRDLLNLLPLFSVLGHSCLQFKNVIGSQSSRMPLAEVLPPVRFPAAQIRYIDARSNPPQQTPRREDGVRIPHLLPAS